MLMMMWLIYAPNSCYISSQILLAVFKCASWLRPFFWIRLLLFNCFVNCSTPLWGWHLKCDFSEEQILFLTFSISIVLKYHPPSGSCSDLWILVKRLSSHISKITKSCMFSQPRCHLFTSISLPRATDQIWDTPFKTQYSWSDDDDDDNDSSTVNV